VLRWRCIAFMQPWSNDQLQGAILGYEVS